MGGVGGDNLKALDLSTINSFEDFVVSPGILLRNGTLVDSKHLGDLAAMVCVCEFVPAEEIGGVREQAGTHGIALAGNRVGASTRPADIAGHQSKINDRLRGAGCFVSLVYAHGPPKGN